MPSVRQKFTETLEQAVGAYAFNIFGVVAGAVIAYNVGLFSLAPWAITVYPAVISARGVIGGLFCGRLSTGLHLGIFHPRFLGNTKSFYLLVQAMITITLETSIAMSFVAVLFGNVFRGITMADFPAILTVITATMTLALVVVCPLSSTVSFLAFKHGLDPDIMLYPVESTVSDLLITTTYIIVVNLFILYGSFGRLLTGFVGLVLLLFAGFLMVRNIHEREFLETVRESTITLAFVVFIVNVTGTALGEIADSIGQRREVYTVYPALIDTMGDVGSVVGSTATTKLALGTLKSSISSVRNHLIEIFGAWFASTIMYSAFSVMSLAIQGLLTLPNLLKFTGLLLIVNILAASVIITVAYSVAILTFHKGLDPDNFVIPIESSLADSITTICLFFALAAFGGLSAAPYQL